MSDYLSELLVGLLTTLELTAASLLLGGLLALLLTGLLEFRWLLEELRVGLFAQELRTPMPVSIKRLHKVWESIAR